MRPVLPGFGLTLGITLTYLGVMVLLPIAALVARAAGLEWPAFWAATTHPQVLSAYRVSLLGSAAAASINLVFGLLVAWVLVRYRFPGRRLVDALVDLPFALPTAVAGIALTALYAPTGWIGRWAEPLGIKLAYSGIGVGIALTFIGLPFVVRTVQPVLEDLGSEPEEAAASLGAGRLQTFLRVILPELWPALLTGFALAFARALGEYGSVVFISGNLPGATEIVPVKIVQQLEQYRTGEATAIAVVMLACSFALLLAINLLQRWGRRRAAP
jgi:sulfate transport system permease protein